MKTLLNCLLSAMASFVVYSSMAQGVGINADGSLPHNSAALDVKHSAKGVLLPRLSLAQRNQVANPATGLLIYQTDNQPGFYYFNGSSWSPVGGSNAITKKGWDFSFVQANGNGFETTSSTYRTVGRFLYRGPNVDGLISDIAAICYTNNFSVSYELRLFDATNLNVIAQSVPSNLGTASNPAAIIISSINNLPANAAIFEIQMRTAGSPGTVGIHTLQVYQ